MITGRIDGGTPIFNVRIIGGRGEEIVEGILDTGFDGAICLPIARAVSLGLELVDVWTSELADGTILADEPVFSGRMEWDGKVIKTRILLTKSADALLGTALLRGMNVGLNYSTGEVVIEEIKEG
ncbi:MAG: hypothetical protein CHKLHMKO_00433 [Candidatus Argoarchaeum ethanivorans]|uniref:Clan AA aspartic protease n=1 Tax=Candidatus Argoarchaeum ethanivorans TaxID=2608793 RepID=A0A811TBX5_9EURY|nr:MAG: hypothetical protein CHKLHMKO_00433 [Candidatus Argoarchaeum ethanivorans]